MAKQLAHKPDQFQQQAIDSTARGIRIVAPAGSGKSETLARRVAKRIEKDGIDPRRILVLTFDNAAKKSLSGFFGSLLDRRQMPQIRTFNGHGNQILKGYFPSEIAPKLENASSDYADLRRRYNARSYEFPVLTWDGVQRSLSDAFGALKEQGYYPLRDGESERQTQWLRSDYFRLPSEGESTALNDYWRTPHATVTDDSYSSQLNGLLEAFIQFENEMRSLATMAYVDQKARASHQLYRSKAAMLKLQDEFDEIVVDECQDISRLDAMLVYYTAGPETLIVLAGDDDQTLYEWRNAHSLYLRKPEIVFQDIEFETVHLDLNYRSPQEILAPAVKLISHNVERIEKSPMSGVQHAGEVRVEARSSQSDLDTGLVAGINGELAAGRPIDDIAVLVNGNRDRQRLNALLTSHGVVVQQTDYQGNITQSGIVLQTYLVAKGQQWPVVFMPDVNDRDVPDIESIRKGEIEMVRRRFYVAMTRAAEKLVFSYVRGGDGDRLDQTAEGEVIGTNGASRFLFEAGLVSASQPEPEEEIPAPASAPSPEPVIATPAGKVTEPVETPPEPEPTPTPTLAPKKKVKLKDWEPRAVDTQRMNKARSEWKSNDHDTAIMCAWKPIESALKRMVKRPLGVTQLDAVNLIDRALEQRVIDMVWRDRLHIWRRVRNQAIHDDGEKSSYSKALFEDYGFQLVQGTTSFFVHLAQRNAPQQLVMETQDEFLVKIGNLVELIQRGQPSPVTGKPFKAIRFDPNQNQFDVLAMQLLMVLRDVRFYVPEEYRWSSSPIIGKFSVETIGHVPQGLNPRSSSKLKLQNGEQLSQLISRMDRLVKQEAGDANPGQFLLQRLQDGAALENGNFHAGLKLNPRAPA